jgi:hypothetical protein
MSSTGPCPELLPENFCESSMAVEAGMAGQRIVPNGASEKGHWIPTLRFTSPSLHSTPPTATLASRTSSRAPWPSSYGGLAATRDCDLLVRNAMGLGRDIGLQSHHC